MSPHLTERGGGGAGLAPARERTCATTAEGPRTAEFDVIAVGYSPERARQLNFTFNFFLSFWRTFGWLSCKEKQSQIKLGGKTPKLYMSKVNTMY